LQLQKPDKEDAVRLAVKFGLQKDEVEEVLEEICKKCTDAIGNYGNLLGKRRCS